MVPRSSASRSVLSLEGFEQARQVRPTAWHVILFSTFSRSPSTVIVLVRSSNPGSTSCVRRRSTHPHSVTGPSYLSKHHPAPSTPHPTSYNPPPPSPLPTKAPYHRKHPPHRHIDRHQPPPPPNFTATSLLSPIFHLVALFPAVTPHCPPLLCVGFKRHQILGIRERVVRNEVCKTVKPGCGEYEPVVGGGAQEDDEKGWGSPCR